MAAWDSADLLAKLKLYLRRPDSDESLTETQGYELLTIAHAQEVSWIAARWPRLLMGAPIAMTTSDNGLTWDVKDAGGNIVAPLGHAEVYATSGATRELFASTYGGNDGDVVFEGTRIRMPRSVGKSWVSGPYARFVTSPTALDASTQPVIVPAPARILIVYRACIEFCALGGLRDPAPFEERHRQARDEWAAALATQYKAQNGTAVTGVYWWRQWVRSLVMPPAETVV